jgi:hypothetical protein
MKSSKLPIIWRNHAFVIFDNAGKGFEAVLIREAFRGTPMEHHGFRAFFPTLENAIGFAEKPLSFDPMRHKYN